MARTTGTGDRRSALSRAAAEVVTRELDALTRLEERLDDGFLDACELILDCPGRVVCIGVGKSGIIARKLAASLASLGTPAHFVHAAEAVHGDLGMIVPGDVCVLFSHSGTTAETVALLPALERGGVRVIAITDGRDSVLAQRADATVCPGVEEEADHLGLAPTASTTAALVLADAIAVAVARVRGFAREDFAARHPGGALGAALASDPPD
ncbi:MAG TPA: SIS domain-containing protein [Nitriliruptorales bacterium]